jgi:hypothetical protein
MKKATSSLTTTVIGVAVKEFVTQGNMAIGCDIQTEYNLLAVWPEILVVTMF